MREKIAILLTSSMQGLLILALLVLCPASYAAYGDNPFSGGWQLDPLSSSLTFQSIKNDTKAETSSFASFQGGIDEQGATKITVQLDSVDTKVDLRNVRMRFLFFETFKYSEAVISAKVDPAALSDLPDLRRMYVPLDFELNLHGITQTLQIETVVTLYADNQVSVASVSPLIVALDLFGLAEGVLKLEEAAGVSIVPVGSVSFNFVFNTGTSLGSGGGTIVAAKQAALTPPVQAAATAVESTGVFSDEECTGRFEILSQTGAVYFRTSSAALDPESRPLLETVVDIINRCPSRNIIVSGHTDSLGDEQANLDLSFARADSVLRYLIDRGVDASRLRSVGFGEARPVAANDTRRNRGRNRRIEFEVMAQ